MLDRTLRSRRFGHPKHLGIRHTKVVNMSAIRASRLYPPRDIRGSAFLLEAESNSGPVADVPPPLNGDCDIEMLMFGNITRTWAKIQDMVSSREVFWISTLCAADLLRRFGGMCCLRVQGDYWKNYVKSSNTTDKFSSTQLRQNPWNKIQSQ